MFGKILVRIWYGIIQNHLIGDHCILCLVQLASPVALLELGF